MDKIINATSMTDAMTDTVSLLELSNSVVVPAAAPWSDRQKASTVRPFGGELRPERDRGTAYGDVTAVTPTSFPPAGIMFSEPPV